MSEPSKEIKLTGWKAVAALVVIAGYGLFRITMQHQALHTDGVEKIQYWLAAEAMRAALPGLERAMEAPDANAEELENAADNLQPESFYILSVSRFGKDDDIVVKIEYRRRGQAEPGNQVRYLRMEYGSIAGWHVRSETNRWRYYMAAF